MAMEVTIHDRIMKNETFWDFKGKVDYVDDWFLMASPIPLALILMAYWSFVLKLGPKYMEAKSAYKLRKVLAVYNMAQIGFSCYLCYVGSNLLLTYGIINKSCLMDKETDIFSITNGTYLYFFAKLTELLDTIFFVLRKNFRQVTFLHVYHHSLMLITTWLTLKYEPTFNTVFLGTLNSYVHVIMYSYYWLSGFPGLTKYLWWKKYITKMQITQFILIILQAAASYFLGCPPSYTLLTCIVINAFLFTGLFIKFYVQSYKKTKSKLKE